MNGFFPQRNGDRHKYVEPERGNYQGMEDFFADNPVLHLGQVNYNKGQFRARL